MSDELNLDNMEKEVETNVPVQNVTIATTQQGNEEITVLAKDDLGIGTLEQQAAGVAMQGEGKSSLSGSQVPNDSSELRNVMKINEKIDKKHLTIYFQGELTLIDIKDRINRTGITTCGSIADDQILIKLSKEETIAISNEMLVIKKNLTDTFDFIYNFPTLNEYGRVIRLFSNNHDTINLTELKLDDNYTGKKVALLLCTILDGHLKVNDGEFVTYEADLTTNIFSEININTLFPKNGYVIKDQSVIPVSYVKTYNAEKAFKIVSEFNGNIYTDLIFNTKEQINTYVQLQHNLNTAKENLENFMKELTKI